MANTNCNSCDSCDSCGSCYSCNSCDSCYSCYYCYSCNSCYSCYSCDSCYYCYSCNSCYSCYSCDYCNYSRGLRMSEKMIFCLGDGKYERTGSGYQKNFMAWNKPITDKRYDEIISELKNILDDWKLDAREDWTKEWGRVRDSQWAKIAKIPEFDLELTKKITGLFKIPVEEEKTLEIEGKKFTVTELKELLKKAS